MTKLQKYNQIILAIISIPALFLITMGTITLLGDFFHSYDSDYDENKGVVSQDKAQKNIEKKEYTQYISYNSMFMLNPEKEEYVVPVIAKTMDKPLRRHKFNFNESTVDEVVFEESDSEDLTATMTLASTTLNNESANSKKIAPKPDTTSLKIFYTEQFVNLVYENGAAKIHKTLINERFTGWDLNYIRIGKKRFLAYLGATEDTNNDGYLNNMDRPNFYLHNLDAGTTTIVQIPNMEIEDYHLMKNTAILFFDVKDIRSPKSHKNEKFIYRYDINTGDLKDIIPNEEKALHLRLITK